MNQIVWENVGAYRDPFNNPSLLERIEDYAVSTVAIPNLFAKDAIASVCLA